MLKPLAALPRDTRDMLFLLGVVGWIMLPHLERVPLWCAVFVVALLAWRGALAVRGAPLPSRWWLLLLLLAAMGGVLFSFRTLLGRDPGVSFIVALLALKTLEMRARRDAFVVFFLGFFTLLTNFFFSQSLLIAASMLLALLGLLTALVNSHLPVGRPSLLVPARTAGWMALLGAPVMVVLFVFFPRIAPLWGLPNDAMTGRSGLSSTMQVGTVAKLALDSRVALRVRFEGEPPPLSALYFRGPVLSSYDGREWTPLRSSLPRRLHLRSELEVEGDPIAYEVTLEPMMRPWVLVLDAAEDAPSLPGYDLRMRADLQWVADRSIAELVRYRAESYTRFRHGPTEGELGLQDFVQLPGNFNPRTLQLAQDLRNDPRLRGAGATALVDAVLERLRTGGYTYSLEPGVYGTHSADEFWFDRKVGFCEHIASAFVILLRALDIPARVVTGYQGGEYNALERFWTVRNSDAHAWAEVWLAGRGWVRVDPTAYVAPGRTGSFERLQPPTPIMTQVFGEMSPALTLRLRQWWDAVNFRWSQWVLNYSQARQFDLLRKLGFAEPNWEHLGYVMIGIVVLGALAVALWTLWERHRQDPWLRLLHEAQARLRRAGLAVPDSAPPRHLLALLSQQTHWPAHERQQLQDWLLALERWRYASQTSADPTTLRPLRRALPRLPWPKPAPGRRD